MSSFRDASMFLFALVAGILATTEARVWGKCELVSQLRNHDIPNDQMSNWVCLAESESSMRSDAIGGPNSDGSYDYGIFQINNRYWCGMNGPGGGCNIKCSDLVDDNLNDDITCAKQIYGIRGFSSWYGWIRKCQNQPLPDVSSC